MKCSKCYNEIPNDSKICPICQNIFATYFEELKLTKKQKIILKLHRIIFPVVFISIILLTFFIIITKHQIKINRITDISNLKLDKTSSHYINDLYISDGRHYKYLLSEKEKNIYNKVYNAILNSQETIDINLDQYEIKTSTFETKILKNIKNIISMDHPELIQLSNISILDINDTNAIIKINYAFTKTEYDLHIETIKEIINEIKKETTNLDEYEKVKFVYEWFYNNTTSSSKKEPSLYSSYGCFINKTCNMYGYSKAVQITLQNIGINSILATGAFNHKYHEWNIVKIDDEYYYYDQTLALTNTNSIDYSGFLFKDKNYKLYYKKLMPTINGKKYLSKQ